MHRERQLRRLTQLPRQLRQLTDLRHHAAGPNVPNRDRVQDRGWLRRADCERRALQRHDRAGGGRSDRADYVGVRRLRVDERVGAVCVSSAALAAIAAVTTATAATIATTIAATATATTTATTARTPVCASAFV